LLQQLVAELDLPVWAAGGIGVHTAAGAVAGGATGIVLDSQLALLRESSLPEEVAAAVRAMDGSETVVAGGHRIFVRPDLPAAAVAASEDPRVVADRLGADDLATDLLPAGQDAALAAPLARSFPTAAALVHGLQRQIAEHLRTAQVLLPLGSDSPLAAAHGVRYPIAQGPMTRVSDRAAFARVVADAGALPFLALALMTGEETRALLEETAALLGDRPYGVGILGFVPPEVREEQLAVTLDVRPPVALIAGGRPAQARPLEAAGIATYLHVPSPGLLAHFLRDGARRFVFEGAECGGHVGPRSSFTLWDSQIRTLLESGAAGETSVLFAGGVHDGRSAAMVAAAAAPLARVGARIGVLMGTAYLFTEEAVASHAIRPAFQEAAQECTATVLLQTAPGHSTRCADTPYVRTFQAEHRRLEDAGTEPTAMWAELEMLNLGRLRIASKGLVRRGERLVEVGEEEQRAEGMVMLGQVAALRSDTTTVVALHEEVSAGASAQLERLIPATESLAAAMARPAPPPAQIAVIGMACCFPGAAESASYWSNLVAGTDSVTEVPAERWDVQRYYDPDALTTGAGRKTPSKWGGFLPDIGFDALEFGIPPRSLASIEPVQLLSLQVASDALADAGYGRASAREIDRDRISVIFGAEAGTDLASAYGFRALAPQLLGGLPPELDERLPELTEDSFPGLLTNVIAGRIANRLDLGGVNYTVDAACASSLAALDAAVKELSAGTSDMVLCGGADLHNGINDYLLFAAVHALSPTGRCASFDASADGIALGEGVACVVLKRLEDARRDGDRVYAVIDGIAGSSDGRSLGLTAPRPEGQRRSLERAYAQAGISPSAVGLVEAHGTGTVVGDRTELAVLTELWEEAGAEVGGTVLGSVKSQIGHTKCAAGLAALIKVARALYHGVLPPTIHLERPNPGYDAEKSPFRFHTEARPWVSDHRIGAVSAFGFGGTNFHAVLRGPDAEDSGDVRHGLELWPAELFALRGETVDEAQANAARLTGYVSTVQREGRGAATLLRDLAADSWAATAGPVRATIVASDLGELAERLTAAGVALGEPGPVRRGGDGIFVRTTDGAPAEQPAVALLFPGQGSQRPGMLADLLVAFPWLHQHIQRGGELASTVFPPVAFGEEERRAQIAAVTDTRVAQPALGMVEGAVLDLLGALGVQPQMVGGHSYGELVALVAAGVLQPDDLLGISSARAEAIMRAGGNDPGAMAAVAGHAEEVTGLLRKGGRADDVVVANDNSPTQVVISGPSDAVDAAVELLSGAGVAARRLPVACAFHSPVGAAGALDLAGTLETIDIGRPAIPVWSNVTAAPYPDDPAAIRAQLAEQVASPVRFREQIEAMYTAGARVFVEAGPGRVMTGLVSRILGDRPHGAVAVDASGRGDIRGLLGALGELVVRGIPIDPGPLFAGRAEPIDVAAGPTHPPEWTVNGHLVRTADGTVVPGGLRAADDVVAPVSPVAMTASSSALSSRDAVVSEYLRSVRELVATGREIMLAYLGSPAGSVPAVPRVSFSAREPFEATPVLAADPSGPATAPEPVDRAAPAALTGERLRQVLLETVSERTGYPLTMLEPGLDLEADLSIDSIKRLEIVSDLAERVGLTGASAGGLDDDLVEELVALKTLASIGAWLEEALVAAPDPTEVSEVASAEAKQTVGAQDVGAAVHIQAPPVALRYVPRLVTIGPARPGDGPLTTGEGQLVAVTGEQSGLAGSVVTRLVASGVEARLVEPGQPLGRCDVLVHCAPHDIGACESAIALLTRVQEALAEGAHAVMAVSTGGGTFGLGAAIDSGGRPEASDGLAPGVGLRGVVKTLAREVPGVCARLVDLDPGMTDPAGAVLEELRCGGPVEVGRTTGSRVTVSVVPVELGRGRTNGHRAPGSGLGPSSVVLVTGGARGITARVAGAIAERYGCTLILAGRTPAPEREDRFPEAQGGVALRRALADAGIEDPRQIEAKCQRILAQREIAATLASLRTSAGSVEYHTLDVRDPEAVKQLVDDTYGRHGRIDGVIHGAGVVEDGRLVDKTPESFRRVFETKVAGAAALGASLRTDPSFVVLFGSVSGLFGNRGQVDYAAANDALAAMGRRLSERLSGRVVTVDWGPWGGGGMVSDPLEKEFARRGVGVLDPQDAIDRLLDELESDDTEPEVVLMRAAPEAFGHVPPVPSVPEHAGDA